MSLQGFGKEVISLGPWGGHDGLRWDDGTYSNVRQIEIAHGEGIDSIKIEYDKNGMSVWSEKHGGNGGSKTDKVKLAYPDEYLTSVHGHYGRSHERGPLFVRSLTFKSNKSTYGPYGVEQGTYFSLPMMRGKIIGFFGKAGWYLDAIGVYFGPLENIIPQTAIIHSHKNISHGTEKYEYSMIQGGMGNNFDLVVAIKRKDNAGDLPKETYSTQTAKIHELNYTGHKNKIEPIVPAKIEKVPSKKVHGVSTFGPWGGPGGTMFDDGVYDGIRQIHISRNIGIVSIRVCYELNGQPVWGSKNGGTGGFKSDKIVFDYPSEVLTHITGYYNPTMVMGPTIIRSLTFHTTKGKHGPYGEEKGQSFSTKLKDGMIVGLHGKGGLFVDAIGVHLLEGKVFPASSAPSKSVHWDPVSVSGVDSNSQWSFKLGRKGLTEEAVQRVRLDPAPYGPGPWGGEGGKPWDDGVFTGIKQIVLTSAEPGICCIEIEYCRNGQSVWSVKHGGSGGKTTHKVKLDYPNEVLTCISGYYGSISKDHPAKVVKSLTFQTTRQKFGPIGEELGSYFTSNTTEGKVVGFHGRCGIYLDAIGVHMQHWLGNQKPKQSSLMKMFS